ncbi:AAA family ATPase [Plantactinospora siamensis]|uniref:AAA family ATPase n=1 Tax=Plantactinospora siamensis TaxID=555372 RepID=A0ABV6NZI5_9ACTN
MDGTDNGWGRPAEPAPRWRALLDRARGGRSADHHEPDARRDEGRGPRGPGRRGDGAPPDADLPGAEPGAPGGQGWSGVPATRSGYPQPGGDRYGVGPAGSTFFGDDDGAGGPELVDRAAARQLSESRYAALRDLSVEGEAGTSRYSALQPEAPAQSADSRYALLEPADPAPDRSWTEPAPDRSWTAPEPDRSWTAPEPDRSWTAPEPDRSWTAPEPDRSWTEPAPRAEPPPPDLDQPPGQADPGRGWMEPGPGRTDRLAAPWVEPTPPRAAPGPQRPAPAAPTPPWTEPVVRPPDGRGSAPAGAGRAAAAPLSRAAGSAAAPLSRAAGSAAVGAVPSGTAAVGGRSPGGAVLGGVPAGSASVGTAPPPGAVAGTAPIPAPVIPAQPRPAQPIPAHSIPAPSAPATLPPGPSIPAQGRVTIEPGYPRTAARRRGQADPETQRAGAILGRDVDRPRVIAFANPKGGVHKTTATVLAAATIGSVRGQGVLAWDDNELRGTLGLRAGSARHARTIKHLVADLMMIEASSGTALYERLDDYLRHASDGSYDVLAGEENSRFASRLDQHTVGRVLDLLRRTHNIICVDTGNNVESANWQTVLRAADQLVITTVPREDAAFTADWMLDLLHETGMGALVENAVTLLSCPTPGRSPLLDDLERHFGTRTRAVAVVPYDPALETGSSIEYGQLQPETRDAWLRAAAVMVEPFVR